MNDELRRFVRTAVSLKVPQKSIEATLSENGWRPHEIREAVNAYTLYVSLPIPVPRRVPSTSAEEAFQYLTLFFTLCVAAVSFCSVLMDVADTFLPDSAYPYYPSTPSMAIASFLVAFPAHLLMSRVIKRQLLNDPTKRESSVRKWLTSVTLFLTGAVALVDLGSVVYSLLEHNAPARFLAKATIVLCTAGFIYFRYRGDIARSEPQIEVPESA